MRHHKAQRKFGRVAGQRKALLRSLAISFIERGRMKTTEAKAKEVRPFVEKLVTTARRGILTTPGTLPATRLIIERLGSGHLRAQRKLMKEIAQKYEKRAGGYTRITKLPTRKSDGARMAIIEFVQ